MKKQKQENIDLLITFQIYLYSKGLIESHDWDFEKQAKKFVKSCMREADKIDEKVEIHFDINAPAAFESFTKLKEQLDEIQKNLSEVKKPDGGIKSASVRTPEGWIDLNDYYETKENKAEVGYKITQELDPPSPYVTFEKSEQEVMDEFKAVINTVIPAEDVIRSYVEESNLNKGEYVLVIQCRNGRKFVVAGQHHSPTYLRAYDQSPDIIKK